MQLWTRAHLWWYCAIPPSVDTKVRQHAQNQARTIEKLTRQIEELKCQIDPSRPNNIKGAIPKIASSDLKHSDTPVRMSHFAKSIALRNTLQPRTNSTSLNSSTNSIQNSDTSFLANIQFSTSLSSGNIQLASSGSESSYQSGMMLRGDSPFGRFRTDDSSCSRYNLWLVSTLIHCIYT